MENIICKNVSFAYPISEYPTLKDVSFSVNEGELCLVIGESAGGKSTLLKLLKKEISPAGNLSGEIAINGSVGYVAQNVDESIVCDKVRSELSFGLTNMGVSGNTIELLVAEAASYFNLEDKLDRDISSLSGGEKQMVNLAAVMIMKPNILVLDEPCSQLDPIASARLVEMIKKLHRDFGLTIVIVEHSTDNLFDYADRVMLVDNGSVAFKLPPNEAVAEMKRTNHKMLYSAPVYMALYDNASTVSQCREIVKSKSFAPAKKETLSGDIALKVKGVSFAYKKGVDVLDDLNFSAYSGKINAVVGPNSSGKSTLLKVMAGVSKAHRGRLKSNGKVSMLCQDVLNLFTHDTCREEVEFGEITSFLEIDEIENQHPYDLSGGQAQRLALAKVLQAGADIILLDEPTKGFDPVLKDKLAGLLRKLCQQGKTVVLVSHDVEFVGRYADVVSFLSRGKIVATAPRREFFSSLNFYTTAVSKITCDVASGIVSVDDLKQLGGADE